MVVFIIIIISYDQGRMHARWFLQEITYTYIWVCVCLRIQHMGYIDGVMYDVDQISM